jgi:hypothetical protein
LTPEIRFRGETSDEDPFHSCDKRTDKDILHF